MDILVVSTYKTRKVYKTMCFKMLLVLAWGVLHTWYHLNVPTISPIGIFNTLKLLPILGVNRFN